MKLTRRKKQRFLKKLVKVYLNLSQLNLNQYKKNNKYHKKNNNNHNSKAYLNKDHQVLLLPYKEKIHKNNNKQLQNNRIQMKTQAAKIHQ